MEALWTLLLSAQATVGGVPAEVSFPPPPPGRKLVVETCRSSSRRRRQNWSRGKTIHKVKDHEVEDRKLRIHSTARQVHSFQIRIRQRLTAKFSLTFEVYQFDLVNLGRRGMTIVADHPETIDHRSTETGIGDMVIDSETMGMAIVHGMAAMADEVEETKTEVEGMGGETLIVTAGMVGRGVGVRQDTVEGVRLHLEDPRPPLRQDDADLHLPDLAIGRSLLL